jgi:plastocyanin
MRALSIAIGATSVILAASCGGGGGSGNGGPTGPGTGGSSATSNDVSVADNYFSPSSTTVAVGSVTWTWTGSQSHNVTFDDGNASPTQASGTYTRRFSAAGTYSYHCTIHGAAMSGTVTVK